MTVPEVTDVERIIGYVPTAIKINCGALVGALAYYQDKGEWWAYQKPIVGLVDRCIPGLENAALQYIIALCEMELDLREEAANGPIDNEPEAEPKRTPGRLKGKQARLFN